MFELYYIEFGQSLGKQEMVSRQPVFNSEEVSVSSRCLLTLQVNTEMQAQVNLITIYLNCTTTNREINANTTWATMCFGNHLGKQIFGLKKEHHQKHLEVGITNCINGIFFP